MKHLQNIVELAFAYSIYVAIGALAHAHFVGDRFDPRSTTSWGWLLAWPVPLLLVALKWTAIIMAFAGVACILVMLVAFIYAAGHHLIKRARDHRAGRSL